MGEKMEERKSNYREVKLKAEIADYDKNIDEYRKALQTESVWLFLAVLGCWGVSNKGIQIFAFVLAIIFFGIQVSSHLTHRRTFSSFEKDIEKLIDSEFISGPLKDDYHESLRLLKEKRASNIQPLKAAPMFVLCFIFLAWSVIDRVVPQLMG